MNFRKPLLCATLALLASGGLYARLHAMQFRGA